VVMLGGLLVDGGFLEAAMVHVVLWSVLTFDLGWAWAWASVGLALYLF
jgi:hypothetical protein